ncbi:MAG: hypothetical protein M5U29_14565 [Anaerolineae bacterium]|nr:hypothetical protein [Anaerolineae bacterium]
MRFVAKLAPLVLLLALTACSTLTGSAEIEQLETRNAQLQSTIEVLGTPLATITSLQNAATQAVLLEAQLAAAQNEALAARATLTVLELTGGGGAIAPTQQALAAPPGDQPPMMVTNAPTPIGTGTRFMETVTATGRDAQDCPTGATSVFAPDTRTIYVITRVNVLPAGSTLSARWTANGQLFYDDTQCWVTDKEWADICAYCSIVPEGATFESGEWTVELLLDGQLMSQAQFRVGEAAAVMPEGGSAVTPSTTTQ